MLDKLKKLEWVSLAKGALIAATGAALTYASQWATSQDFGLLAPTVTALLSVAVNFIRKYSTTPKADDFDLFKR